MKGKIISVDVYENIGTLIDEEGNELPFSLDDCVGFDDTPQENEEVKFGVSGGEVFFVEPLTTASNNTQFDFDDYDNEYDHYEETETQDYIAPKEKKRDNTFQSYIPIDIPIKQCIKEHFSDVTYSIEEYEAQFENYEELNYPLMKRFLTTAYNNLVDMDSGFMDDELLELRSDLQALDSIYTKLKKKESVPAIAYENIFLEKQPSYKSNKKRLESNTSEIFTLESSAKSIEAQIKDIDNKIKQGRVLKEVIKEWEKDLKRYRTYYVDTLHKMATLKDENVQLKEILEKFAKKYEKEFLELYEEESEKCFGLLKRQLDGYAHVFDQKMWERAETSSSIIAFFRKAHIDDEFSSKTFLKYFIKSLDKNKMSKELKKLEDLLYYLQSKAKMRIIIVEENTHEGDKIKHIIRRIDKDYSVESVDKPRSIYYRRDLKIIDFIFVDYSMKNPPILEFLSMIQARIKQSGSRAKLCILSKKINKELITNIKKLSINNLISLHVSEKELTKNIKSIIESE